MVQRRVRAGHSHSVLSRSSPPDAAAAKDDVRSRGRNRAGMHAHPPPRSRTRRPAFLSIATAAALAAALRSIIDPLSRVLSAEPGQQELCPTPPTLVCPEPPGRGFRRDLRRLAQATLGLANALRR